MEGECVQVFGEKRGDGHGSVETPETMSSNHFEFEERILLGLAGPGETFLTNERNHEANHTAIKTSEEVSESRNLDLLELKKRQVLKMLLGKKHVTRIMNLRIAFQQIKTACQIVHFQSRVKDQYHSILREMKLLQVDSATSRLRVFIERMRRRQVAIGFSTWQENTLGTRDAIRRRRRILSYFFERSYQANIRRCFDKIRREAMLQTKLKLDTLERFLSKEKAEKMRYGMRNFMIVCLRTMERKKKFRMLRAFNRIFSYGLAKVNERNRAIIEKSKHVLNFVRKLRHEIVEDDEEENSKHHDAFPRTPMERPMSVSPDRKSVV